MTGRIRGTQSQGSGASRAALPGKGARNVKSIANNGAPKLRDAKKVNGSNGKQEHGSNGKQQGRVASANGKSAHGSNGAGYGKSAGMKANGVKPAGRAAPLELPANYRPSDREPFMNELQRLYFRTKLVAWKEEILRSTRETLHALHEESLHFADLADRATSESDKALELRARDRQRKLVAKIDAALERLDNGTYGYCRETGEPIGLKRLDARPVATLSVEAQERHERRERVYRDD